MIDSILFDLDGVALNSEPLKESAHRKTVSLLNKNYPENTYASVLGGSSEYVFNYIQQVTGIDISFKEYNRLFLDIYFKLLKHCEFTDGFINFFKKLKIEKFKIGIVTSCTENMLSDIKVLEKIIDDIDCLVFADMVTEHKPSPMPYLKAVLMLEKQAEQIIAFEDTSPGIQSARSAGLRVIGMKHSLTQYQDYSGTISIWNDFTGNKYSIFQTLISQLP